MNQTLIISGLFGATAVAMGAYAAHGLDGLIESMGFSGEEVARRVENFQTGARYQLHAAAALLAIGLAPSRGLLRSAATSLAIGAVIFCGLLYALAFVGDDWRWLGAIVPIGGLAMIVGWALLALCGVIRLPAEANEQPLPTTNLVRLEELFSHQQHLLQNLDTTITELSKEADARESRLARLEAAAKRLIDTQRASEEIQDERPPHY